MKRKQTKKVQKDGLAWYKSCREPLPWRADYGESQHPYLVLVSEIMLQQTRRAVVKDRFQLFLERFPNIEALAQASIDDVLTLWAGMGYYRRAHFLHKAAIDIVTKGFFPEDKKELLKIAGIGAYTSAAIRSFAFRKDDHVMDGNIQRVMARFGGHREDSFSRQQQGIAETLAEMHPDGFGAEWYQCLMDLGASICGVKSVQCEKCPLQSGCKVQHQALSLKLHKRAVKVSKRHMYVLLIKNQDNAYLMERSQTRSLFQGLWTFPYRLHATEQHIEDWGKDAVILPTTFVHVLTHLRLEIHMVVMSAASLFAMQNLEDAREERTWLNYSDIKEFSLSSSPRWGFPRWVGKVIDHLEGMRIQ